MNDVCGIPMLANSLMHHGEAVARGALPWLVALYEARSKLVYKCCGNLISQKHVITGNVGYQFTDVFLRMSFIHSRPLCGQAA